MDVCGGGKQDEGPLWGAVGDWRAGLLEGECLLPGPACVRRNEPLLAKKRQSGELCAWMVSQTPYVTWERLAPHSLCVYCKIIIS